MRGISNKCAFERHSTNRNGVNVGFYQNGNEGTGLVASLTKEIAKNKDEIVKTASSALNLSVSRKPFLIRIS